MKKIILIALISILMIGCTNDEKQSIKLPEEVLSTKSTTSLLSEIKMGMSEADVVKIMGEPERITSISEQNGSTVLTKYNISLVEKNGKYVFQIFQFSFLNGKLFHYKIYRNKN